MPSKSGRKGTVAPRLATPTLTLGAVGTNNIAMSWTSVPSATSYVVERANDALFTVALTIVYNSTGTSFTNSSLAENTQYYYRVKAKASGYTDSFYSNMLNPTTGIAGGGGSQLSTPVLQRLGLGTTSSYFNWGKIANASNYEVQRATNSSFTSPTILYDGVKSGVTRAFQPGYTLEYGDSGLIANTTYYYRVRAKATGYTTSNWSTTLTLTTGDINRTHIFKTPNFFHDVNYHGIWQIWDGVAARTVYAGDTVAISNPDTGKLTYFALKNYAGTPSQPTLFRNGGQVIMLNGFDFRDCSYIDANFNHSSKAGLTKDIKGVSKPIGGLEIYNAGGGSCIELSGACHHLSIKYIYSEGAAYQIRCKNEANTFLADNLPNLGLDYMFGTRIHDITFTNNIGYEHNQDGNYWGTSDPWGTGRNIIVGANSTTPQTFPVAVGSTITMTVDAGKTAVFNHESNPTVRFFVDFDRYISGKVVSYNNTTGQIQLLVKKEVHTNSQGGNYSGQTFSNWQVQIQPRPTGLANITVDSNVLAYCGRSALQVGAMDVGTNVISNNELDESGSEFVFDQGAAIAHGGANGPCNIFGNKLRSSWLHSFYSYAFGGNAGGVEGFVDFHNNEHSSVGTIGVNPLRTVFWVKYTIQAGQTFSANWILGRAARDSNSEYDFEKFTQVGNDVWLKCYRRNYVGHFQAETTLPTVNGSFSFKMPTAAQLGGQPAPTVGNVYRLVNSTRWSWIKGTITAYNSSTGDATMNVTSINGGGNTHYSWLLYREQRTPEEAIEATSNVAITSGDGYGTPYNGMGASSAILQANQSRPTTMTITNPVSNVMINPFTDDSTSSEWGGLYGDGLMRVKINDNIFGTQTAATSALISLLASTNIYAAGRSQICGNTYLGSPINSGNISAVGGAVGSYTFSSSSCAP